MENLSSSDFRNILTQHGLDSRSDADLSALFEVLERDGLANQPDTEPLINYACRRVLEQRGQVPQTQPIQRTEVQTMSDQFDNAAFRDILSGAGLNPDSLEDINAFKSALDSVEGDGPEVVKAAAIQAKLARREQELKSREAKGERVNANEWMTLGYEREAAKRAPAKPATNPIDLIPTEQLSDPTELMRRGLAEQRRKLQKK